MKKCTMPTTRIIVVCLSLILVGFLISYAATSALAAEVYKTTSAEYNFTVGGKNYKNYADLIMTEDGYSFPGVWVESKSGMVSAGYFGARARLYKETSPGANTYYLITAGAWTYNQSACTGYHNLADREDNLPAGYYMSCGESAVYYNGTYVRYWTYPTPFIQIR